MTGAAGDPRLAISLWLCRHPFNSQPIGYGEHIARGTCMEGLALYAARDVGLKKTRAFLSVRIYQT